jgi:hypothetical protein
MRVAAIAPSLMRATIAQRLSNRGADVTITVENGGSAGAARPAGQ